GGDEERGPRDVRHEGDAERDEEADDRAQVLRERLLELDHAVEDDEPEEREERPEERRDEGPEAREAVSAPEGRGRRPVLEDDGRDREAEHAEDRADRRDREDEPGVDDLVVLRELVGEDERQEDDERSERGREEEQEGEGE